MTMTMATCMTMKNDGQMLPGSPDLLARVRDYCIPPPMPGTEAEMSRIACSNSSVELTAAS